MAKVIKLFSEARETSIGSVVSVVELPDIEGEEGIVISGISNRGRGAERFNICFRTEAANILTNILNEWNLQKDKGE